VIKRPWSKKLAYGLVALLVVMGGLALSARPAVASPTSHKTVVGHTDPPEVVLEPTVCGSAPDDYLGSIFWQYINAPDGVNLTVEDIAGPGFNSNPTGQPVSWVQGGNSPHTGGSQLVPVGTYTVTVHWLTTGQTFSFPGISVIACGGSSPPPPTCNGSAINPIAGLAPSYSDGHVNGYWKSGAAGGVSAFGGAVFHGSMGGCPLNQPVIGMASTPTGGGYWLVAKDGGIFAFGDAGFYGSMGATPLDQPVIAMAATPNNKGYWLVASDGGIFAFGDAGFYGSMGGRPLDQPVVGMASTPDGRGYWLVASDGGIFAFGDAGFYGSMGGLPLNQPVVGMVSSHDGPGYLLVASDGGIFAFGDAPFYGSTGSNPPSAPVIGVVEDDQGGYWLVTSSGQTLSFGGAPNFG
jgi:hypothetical protein